MSSENKQIHSASGSDTPPTSPQHSKPTSSLLPTNSSPMHLSKTEKNRRKEERRRAKKGGEQNQEQEIEQVFKKHQAINAEEDSKKGDELNQEREVEQIIQEHQAMNAREDSLLQVWKPTLDDEERFHRLQPHPIDPESIQKTAKILINHIGPSGTKIQPIHFWLEHKLKLIKLSGYVGAKLQMLLEDILAEIRYSGMPIGHAKVTQGEYNRLRDIVPDVKEVLNSATANNDEVGIDEEAIRAEAHNMLNSMGDVGTEINTRYFYIQDTGMILEGSIGEKLERDLVDILTECLTKGVDFAACEKTEQEYLEIIDSQDINKVNQTMQEAPVLQVDLAADPYAKECVNETFDDPDSTQYIAQQIRDYFAGKAVKKTMKGIHWDLEGLHDQGLTYEAIFMDRDYNIILDSERIYGSIGLKVDRHMTTMNITITKNSPYSDDDSDDENFAKDEEVNDGPESEGPDKAANDATENAETKTNERVYHEYSDPSAAEEAKTVFSHLNYQAIRTIDCIRLGAKQVQTLSGNIKEEWNSWPKEARQMVNRWNARGFYTYHLTLRMDPKYIAGENFNIGTPGWAQNWVDAMKSGYIRLIFRGLPNTMQELTAIGNIFAYQKSSKFNNPLRVWHTNPGRLVFKQNAMNFKYKTDKTYGYKALFSFHNFDHYATVAAVGLDHEEDDRIKAEARFENMKHEIILISMAGYMNRTFIGLIKRPDDADADFRLQPGTFMEIRLHPEKGTSSCVWTGRVTEPIPYVPKEYIPLIVRRGKMSEMQLMPDASRKKVVKWDPLEVSYLNAGSITTDALTRAISKIPGIKATMSLKSSDTVFKKCFWPLDRLSHTPEDETNTQWQNDALHLLPATEISKIKTRNGLACITQTLPKFWEKEGGFNKEQLAAFEQMTILKGGIAILDGPPGTGKTHVTKSIALHMMRCEEKHMAVLLTHSNDAANSLANELQKEIAKAQRQGIIPKNRYIIRLHSRNAEQQITNSFAKSSKSSNPEALRHYIEAEEFDALEEEIGVTASILRDAIERQNFRPFKNVTDPRVKEFLLSPSVAMFRKCGIINDEPHMVAQDTNKYQSFKTYYLSKARGDGLTKEEKKKLKELTKALYIETLEGASVILATVTGIYCDHDNMEVITKHCRILALDEAMKVKEWELLPFFGAPFTQLDMFLMAGDWRQLGPRAQGQELERSHAPFRQQIAVSLPSRLARVGFPVSYLYEQNRMVPEIAALLNELTYHNTLRNASRTGLQYRPAARHFRGLVREIKSTKSKRTITETASILTVDFTGQAVVTRKGTGMSKYCDAYILWLVSNLEAIVKGFPVGTTFGIITPYTEERNRLMTALTTMELEGVVKDVFDRVHVRTIDGCQGHEFNIVFLLFTIDRNFGHTADRRRINVALSRAKDGLFVLTNKIQAKRARGNGAFFKKTLSALDNGVNIYLTWDKLPKSAYYTPNSERISDHILVSTELS